MRITDEMRNATLIDAEQWDKYLGEQIEIYLKSKNGNKAFLEIYERGMSETWHKLNDYAEIFKPKKWRKLFLERCPNYQYIIDATDGGKHKL